MMRSLFIIFFFLSPNLFCQEEILSNLVSNPSLQDAKFIYEYQKSAIDLPFFDDFSYNTPVADNKLWLNSSVFVNRTYALNPPTVGVATFDGLDENGLARDFYQFNSTDPSDTLLSQIIDLSLVNKAYLMFYYQGQGIGDEPQTEDLLVLDFLNDSLVWEEVWFSNGKSMQEFKKYVEFIDQPRFLHNSFQFRFRNYATLSGNFDHWHIDYIKLDEFILSSDTARLNDISFVYGATSFLNRYEQMPWSHFKNNSLSEMNDTAAILLRNNGVLNTVSIGYQYKVFEDNIQIAYYPSLTDSTWRSPDPPTSFLDYDLIGNFQFNNPSVDIANSLFITPQTLLKSDSVSFLIQHIIRNGQQQDNWWNDTLYYNQQFNSCFAYDDGVAEAAYGINVSGASLAYQFKLNRPDILRAVQIYFPQMLASVDHIKFDLTVWDDNGGRPGTIIYQKEVTPRHTENGEYHYYYLDSILQINNYIFYVGWVQQTDDLLNVGLDKNKSANQYMFYNTGSGWNNSSFSSALMIRPIISQHEVILNQSNTSANRFLIHPNPANDVLFVKSLSDNNLLSIYSLQGELIKYSYFMQSETNIDLSSLSTGIYIIELQSEGASFYKKLIIN